MKPAQIGLTAELSGPARLLSTQKRVLAGSAPAICYAYPMHGRLAEAERLLQQGSGQSGEGPLAAAIQTGRIRFTSSIIARPAKVIGRRRAGPRRQDVRNQYFAARADVQGALI